MADDPALGILFYRAKQSFYLPYHLLQAMRYEADQITLIFAAQDVVINGRGLHQLYRQLPPTGSGALSNKANATLPPPPPWCM